MVGWLLNKQRISPRRIVMIFKDTLISASITSLLGLGASVNVQAAPPSKNAVLSFTPNTTCILDLGTFPNCTYGINLNAPGSYFDMPGFSTTAIQSHDGIILGQDQPASGSHSDIPDGTESPGIDEPWSFFGNTGMHQTTAPIQVLTNDDAGNVTLDLSGWYWTWNGIPTIPLNGDPDNFGLEGNTGIANMTCSVDGIAADCVDGADYVLDYEAQFQQNDPSNLGGARYRLHLEGVISGVLPDAILPIPSLITNACTNTIDFPFGRGGSTIKTFYNQEQMNFFGTFVHSSTLQQGLPFNGSAYLQTLMGYKITIESEDALPFGLVSVDLAEYSNVHNYPYPSKANFVGLTTDFEIVKATFVIDGIMDGRGPLDDFETFYFPASFQNLQSVSTEVRYGVDKGFSLDNLVVAPSPDNIAIDVKPDDSNNVINLNSNGPVSIAILSSSNLDSTMIPPESINVSGALVRRNPKNGKYLCRFSDVNDDSLEDMVCKIEVKDLLLNENNTEVVLSARAGDGTCLKGEDYVRIIQPH